VHVLAKSTVSCGKNMQFVTWRSGGRPLLYVGAVNTTAAGAASASRIAAACIAAGAEPLPFV
jgi:hypothetical protein